MRTHLRTLLVVAALAACAPGAVIVVREPVSNPRPAPRPAPAPAPLAPLEVDIGRPHRGQILVQTNRPAYVALFEIVPEQGVRLVHPSSARERRFLVSGPRRLPVWFDEARVTPAASRGPARERVRYIYALASDEPLRITDEAFHAGYLRTVLGPVTYRGVSPYSTMRAIASRFAPSVREEKWAEDVIVLDARRPAEPQHVARVYCPGGVVIEIPEELADRAWCPGRRGGTPGSAQPAGEPAPSRPDSVKGNNGRRVQMRAHGTPGEQPRSRVRESMVAPQAGQPESVPAQGNPGGQAQDADKPGERRGQDEDRPGNRRGQTEDKPGNGPPSGAGVPGSAATPANTGRPETAGPPSTSGRPDNAGRDTAQQADAAKPGNVPSGRGQGQSQQQQPTQEPHKQHPEPQRPPQSQGKGNGGAQAEPQPATGRPAAAAPATGQPQPAAGQSEASPPQTTQPATAQPQPSKPASGGEPQGNQAQGRGKAKQKTAPDSTSAPPTQQTPPDTAAKPGKGRPPVPQH